MSGEFAGRKCFVIVISTPRTNIVCGISVIFELVSETWTQIKSVYEDLVWLYTRKYGNPILEKKEFMGSYKEGDGLELYALKQDQCIYKTEFSYLKDGVCVGNIIIEMMNSCQVAIMYYDKINVAQMNKELVQDI